MEQETLKIAYEQIDNQILRILLYFGGAVIFTLSGALAYLWNVWRNDQRERIKVDIANAEALVAVTRQLEAVKDELAEVAHELEKIKRP